MDLLVTYADRSQNTFNIEAFNKEVISIGRQADNDIVLSYDFVSRVHSAIYREGGALYIEDLGSTNGMYVNGSRVKKARLNAGDNIVIARSITDSSGVKIVVRDTASAIQNNYVQQYAAPPVIPAPQMPHPYMQQYGYMDFRPMGWYKFLIYFLLFFGAFLCVMLGIGAFQSAGELQRAHYDVEESLSYLEEWFGQEIDLGAPIETDTLAGLFWISGIISFVAAILCIVVRFELAGFKRCAPAHLGILSFVFAGAYSMYGTAFYYLAALEIYYESLRNWSNWTNGGTDGMVSDDELVLMILVTFAVCMLIAAGFSALNKIYFNKRQDLFIYQ